MKVVWVVDVVVIVDELYFKYLWLLFVTIYFIDVQLERKHEEFKHGIEQFPTEKLKPVETDEKVLLPSKEGSRIIYC